MTQKAVALGLVGVGCIGYWCAYVHLRFFAVFVHLSILGGIYVDPSPYLDDMKSALDQNTNVCKNLTKIGVVVTEKMAY